MAPNKRRALFISPMLPQLTGHGSAMRAGMSVEALASRYTISLLVIQLGRENRLSRNEEFARRYCADVSWHSPDTISKGAVSVVDEILQAGCFDIVHVFRITTALFMEQLLVHRNRPPVCGLDLDDYESDKSLRFRNLCVRQGDWVGAAAHTVEMAEFRRLEERYVPQFDRVFVANDRDRIAVASNHGCDNVFTLPNAIRLPPAASPPATSTTLRLLFVGTMDYLPNVDAVTYFCSEILPLIRMRMRTVRLVIVGARPVSRVVELERISGVTVVGEVDNPGEYYTSSDVVVVPLRTGAGTRLKVLEAFSLCRPVVSTTVGVEGLEVRSGRHLLLADSAEQFASCCLRLCERGPLREAITESARSYVAEKHGPAKVQECFDRAYLDLNSMSYTVPN